MLEVKYDDSVTITAGERSSRRPTAPLLASYDSVICGSRKCHMTFLESAIVRSRGALAPMTRRILLSAFAMAALLVGCATTPAPAPLADTLARDPQLSTFNRLVAQAGLTEELRAAGPLTVLAPTDDAFKAVPAKTLEALAADPAQLKAVLSYHVIAGNLASAEIKPGSVKTRQGSNLTIAKAGTFITADDAVVQQTDVVATNGVAHIIDRVLMPPKKP